MFATFSESYPITERADMGPQIKYLRVPDEIVDLVKDQQQNQPSTRGRGGGVQRGDHGGRGDRGRGGGRGGARGRGRGRG